ncbi:flavoprotein, putative [Bodo saltans]|uniref:Flavoprotein, putative n=1 Tax=Bodo saltans TaxID=75058 RepID=A0A0S4J7M3_BODSA|nr:flavoprotein, putative [Bodo saltans]|eukprot:CUG87242.1 flavoprotein, putative [Bodo saltans]
MPFPTESEIQTVLLHSLLERTLDALPLRPSKQTTDAIQRFLLVLFTHNSPILSISDEPSPQQHLLNRHVKRLATVLPKFETKDPADNMWSFSKCTGATTTTASVEHISIPLTHELIASVHAWLVAALYSSSNAYSTVNFQRTSALEIAVRKLQIAVQLMSHEEGSMRWLPQKGESERLIHYIWNDGIFEVTSIPRRPLPENKGEFGSSCATSSRGNRILLLCTGSVACVKVPQLIQALRSVAGSGDNVGCRFPSLAVVTTNAALFFLRTLLSPETHEPVLSEGHSIDVAGVVHRSIDGVPVFTDEDEWLNWRHVGDDVLHIELRKNFDVALIAPLDANTLAKLAGGISDNLVTCVMRAWHVQGTNCNPVVAAPAMNTLMWDHPLTAQHLHMLFGGVDGVDNAAGPSTSPSAHRLFSRCALVEPVEKKLACGDIGKGAMGSVEDIVAAVQSVLQ